ncbi:Fe2+-dependent dioxygenase [Rhodoferax sp. TBRC 17198]|uniref:Fe2+-dependent dioxygenase n=1 Tax=Rhodoferax potami TaxID=3068338 RepID=A0ABU3KIQ8_9BURK|nr:MULTISPECIES: Fe2+-dependent dioxygenase [unclassified Rhodoferax]MDT7517461.1 Fe2+-dependent dioxygenase [Rhodoferax sp. TBRC 17660]MDT7521748.1 Fe2+-dependent dioxygenase [Rhodoferax sp. TBRC 17198]
MLLHLPDLLTSDEVAHAQHLLKEAPWTDGRKGTGELARQVKNNEQLDHEGDIARSIRELVLRGLDRNTTFFSAALPKKVFPPRVNRYGGDSNFYGNHIDGAIRYMPGNGQRLRTDVSCTVFLNDPEDYDGGELTIADTYGEKTVKLPAGHAVLYPGTSLHQVKPVTRGHRIACFFWIESLVRSDEQRRMLYELDMNLLAMRRRHGDSEETTALTGVYHNMLRMWADT